MKRPRAIAPPRLFLPALLMVGVTSAAARAGDPRAIVAGGWIDRAGRIQTGGVVLVENGAIKQVGGELPAGTTTDEYPGAVLSPGLIDCAARLGVRDGVRELADAVAPEIRTADAFNRYSAQLRAALAAGVTTFALLPDDQNLIGGRIAICQTAGPDSRPVLLTDAGPLKLSLSPDAFKTDRVPNSRSGALGLLRETLAAARRDAQAEPALAAFAAGKVPGILTAPSAADVLAVLEIASEHKLKLAFIHSADARHIAEVLGRRGSGVIVGPLDLNSGPRDATAPGILAGHDVPVALAGGLPDQPADALRIAAAVAARAGLAPAAARRAITTVPAELLGVGERIGVLAEGYQADVVVFSGDPLDLRTRVLAVYIAGRRVYTAPAQENPGEHP